MVAVGLLWDCCETAVRLLWDCCGLAPGLLWDCCRTRLGKTFSMISRISRILLLVCGHMLPLFHHCFIFVS